MIVAELIEQLKKYPADKRVVVDGYEDGFDDVVKVEELLLKLNHYTEWYYGEHEESKDENGVKAIYLKGNRRQR